MTQNRKQKASTRAISRTEDITYRAALAGAARQPSESPARPSMPTYVIGRGDNGSGALWDSGSGHLWVSGAAESGKTSLLQLLARQATRYGVRVAVATSNARDWRDFDADDVRLAITEDEHAALFDELIAEGGGMEGGDAPAGGPLGTLLIVDGLTSSAMRERDQAQLYTLIRYGRGARIIIASAHSTTTLIDFPSRWQAMRREFVQEVAFTFDGQGDTDHRARLTIRDADPVSITADPGVPPATYPRPMIVRTPRKAQTREDAAIMTAPLPADLNARDLIVDASGSTLSRIFANEMCKQLFQFRDAGTVTLLNPRKADEAHVREAVRNFAAENRFHILHPAARTD